MYFIYYRIKFLQKKNKYINLFGYNFWVGDIEKDPFKRTDFIGTVYIYI